MRLPPALVSAVCAAAASLPAAAQSTEFLIDFGDDTLQTGVQAQVWNDLHDENWNQVLPLVDSAGNPSSVTLSYPQPIGRTELNGIQAPAPGSKLEQLGWPVTALGDTIGSDTLAPTPEVRFVLDGLDPTATYDFNVVGSVQETGVSLASEYTFFGEDEVATLGEVAMNTSEVLSLAGLRALPDGTLELRIRNATTNTSHGRRFYINAMSMVEHPAGTRPALVGFSANRLDTSRPLGAGGVAAHLGIYTSNGSMPPGSLQALDLATGLPPVWLSLPPTATPGIPFGLVIDPGQLPLGTYTAMLSVTAEGFVGGVARVFLVVRDPTRLNLLFYGNSYSNGNGTVTEIVDRLAGEAGFTVPNSVARFAPGKNLSYHLSLNQVQAISRSMPLGEEWDVVVLQGGTVEAAATVGNPTGYVDDGLAIMTNVRAHSPACTATVFQTWARAEGHSFYVGPGAPYPGGPLDMHVELEVGNQALADALDATFGLGTAVVAPVGETAALRGFDPLYYNPDLSHPAPALTAQAAGTLFGAIFRTAACAPAPDFTTPGPLATHLATIGLDEDDWHSVAGIADRAGPGWLRPYPGAGEDLLLETGATGLETACGDQAFPAGTKLRILLTSPAGTYAGEPAHLYVDLVGATGGSTFVPPWEEVHFTPSAIEQQALTVLGGGGSFELVPPLALVGRSLLVQGLSEGASPLTGHALTLTDAHVLQVLPPPVLQPSSEPQNP